MVKYVEVVGDTPIQCSQGDDRPPVEEAATDNQSRQGIVTHGIGFACGIIYATSIVITAGQCDAT